MGKGKGFDAEKTYGGEMNLCVWVLSFTNRLIGNLNFHGNRGEFDTKDFERIKCEQMRAFGIQFIFYPLIWWWFIQFNSMELHVFLWLVTLRGCSFKYWLIFAHEGYYFLNWLMAYYYIVRITYGTYTGSVSLTQIYKKQYNKDLLLSMYPIYKIYIWVWTLPINHFCPMP